MTLCKSLATLFLTICSISGCGSSDQTSREHADDAVAEPHEEGRVALTPAAALAAGVAIATAGTAPINEVLTLYGTVQANSERVADITARFPGVIRTVSARVGDSVRQGQVVATVESDESLQTYPVPATLSGVITARKANPGEKAGDAPLFTVADLSTVWVELSMFPRDLARVHAGQKVRVRSVDNGLSSEGTIVNVASLGQATSQTLAARVVLDNRERKWVPGLYVSGDVHLSERQVPVAVKSSALQMIGGVPVVFTVSGASFKAQTIEPGLADGEYTEIRTGLNAGDRYAAANSFVLKSELGKGAAGHED